MPGKNPIDEYQDAVLEKRAERDQHHLQLWQTWKQDPTPNNLQPLLKQFDRTFGAAVKTIKAPNVNEAAFRGVLAKNAISAFESYDPNRGASLTTHVTNYIQKAKRFNTKAQNMAYIPEDKVKYIGKIDAARDELRDDLGRDPTHQEIGSRVGISGKLVKEIQGLRRADIRASSFQSDPVGHVGSRDREVISLLKTELKGDDLTVYNYLYGQNGMPKIESTGDIAKRMGKSPSQISRIKNHIAALYNQYL